MLGPLAFFLFVVCAVTGLYLYAVFDTSLQGAYESGRALDESALGSVLRGVHRYSADGFVLATAAHLVRELWRRHFHHFRAWSWLSGLVLVPLAWIAGITGFWLAWDERALHSVVAAAEWMAAWPVEAAAFTRNFLVPEALSDRFFSLAVFLHIGVPLLALAATWAHLQRLAHARVWPPRPVMAGLVPLMVAMAMVLPATSAAPADFFAVPEVLAYDWFYFFPHAVAAATSGEALWMAAIVAAVALCALPWWPRRAIGRPAAVDLRNCNGCGRCVDDCPFDAITLVARTDTRRHATQAQVDTDRCAACGICAGACPSSTPFRRLDPLVTGIDLPNLPISALRHRLDERLGTAPGLPVVFHCRHAAAAANGAAIVVECAGQVPPSFAEYALRHGASEVAIEACAESACEYRLGARWTRLRFERRRAPMLRRITRRDRIHLRPR